MLTGCTRAQARLPCLVWVTGPRSTDAIARAFTLLTGLDSQGFVFDAAFWLLSEDGNKWHLVLSSRSVRKDGSLQLYRKVDKVFENLRLWDVIWIGMVSILDNSAQIVQSLRRALGIRA